MPKFELNLNRHYKGATDKSFVDAMNVMVDSSKTCITREPGNDYNKIIHNAISSHYGDDNFMIITCIPCNTELIIFSIHNISKKTAIFRYIEYNDSNEIQGICFTPFNTKNSHFKYNYGDITGTFTYNYLGELIITFSEYGDNVKGLNIPLRTINLGDINKRNLDVDFNKQYIIPKIKIPKIINIKYDKGRAYKGWYYFFIRYKINNQDYTQWYNIGSPIFISNVSVKDIIRYPFAIIKGSGEPNRDNYNSYRFNECISGCADHIEDEIDICNKTVKFDILDKNKSFDYYQIGFICATKSYNKAFTTKDIYKDSTSYTLNYNGLIETSSANLIETLYNPMNVGNITNYYNRCYISNYKEIPANIKFDTSKINISLITENKSIDLYRIEGNIFYNNTKSLKPNKIYSFTELYDVKENSEVEFSYIVINKVEAAAISYIFNNKGIDPYDYNSVPDKYKRKVIYKAHDIRIKNNRFYVNDNGWKELNKNLEHKHLDVLNRYIYVFNVKFNVINKFYNGEKEIELTETINLNSDGFNNPPLQVYDKSISFDQRINDKTLIPGEIYSFYIHFVDEYGQVTNGIKIDNKGIRENNSLINNINGSDNIFVFDVIHRDNIYYCSVKITDNIIIYEDGQYILNLNNAKYYRELVTRADDKVYLYGVLNDSNPDDLVLKSYIEENIAKQYNSFINSKYENVKWCQIANLRKDVFNLYINSSGDKLYKVPNKDNFIVNDNKLEYTLYGIKIDGVSIPKGYSAYFISYEKFEPTIVDTGVLTQYDTTETNNKEEKFITVSNSYIVKENDISVIKDKTLEITDNGYFYSGNVDISDKIKLNFDHINIISSNNFSTYEYYYKSLENVEDTRLDSAKQYSISPYNFIKDSVNVKTMNKIQIKDDKNKGLLSIKDPVLRVANSSSQNRLGKSSCITFGGCKSLFNNSYKSVYKVQLINSSNDIYTSKNKTLIRCTDYIYSNAYKKSYNFNGFVTFDGCLVFRDYGVNFDESTSNAYVLNKTASYIPNVIDSLDVNHNVYHQFGNYIQYPVITDIPLEAKKFKNNPKSIFRPIFVVEHYKHFGVGCMVSPQNTVDLFERMHENSDFFNPIIYTNYKEDFVYLENFNKTIRRSNQFKDESSTNAWRKFPIEGYKHIIENKGNITSLIVSGLTFLVHTEHSLFMFDLRNVLTTKDNNVQTVLPDVFDAPYKEVFNTQLGYGGLQDKHASIVDTFGYIYYDNHSKRLYRLDGNTAIPIDDSIYNFIRYYNPDKVRIANDKDNKRILICMSNKFADVSYTISYSYITNTFISFHSYFFNAAYSTKNKLYMQHDKSNIVNFFHVDSPNCDYLANCMFTPGIDFENHSKISIICNDAYDVTKIIEYIKYKMNKIPTIDYDVNSYKPVGRGSIPYAGFSIRIYNDIYDTGEIIITPDTSVIQTKTLVNGVTNSPSDYTQPYYNLGVWNFNNIRNKITDYTNDRSPIKGNFFIVEFTMESGIRFEFENIYYNVNKENKI